MGGGCVAAVGHVGGVDVVDDLLDDDLALDLIGGCLFPEDTRQSVLLGWVSSSKFWSVRKFLDLCFDIYAIVP